MRRLLSIITLLILVSGLQAFAGESGDLPKGLQGLTFEGLYYLKYQAGQESNGTKNYNQFAVKRGYLTVKKKINDMLSSRITMDTYQDASGDMKVRVKYIYADFKLPGFAFITKPHTEFGLVHTTWLDFEEHIDYYRMLDEMFMERAGIFNSGDFGLTFAGYFAGELDEEYQKTVNKKYPGRYGSFAIGIYNGGGYHAKEDNQNKSLQARITIRPLPDNIPGLQVSYLGITGVSTKISQSTTSFIDWSDSSIVETSVTTIDNDWLTNAMMISFEHQYFTLTGTYVIGYGNKSGSISDQADYSGISLFCAGKLTEEWRVIGRFDSFDPDVDVSNDAYTRIVAGAGYDFGHENILILDYEIKSYEATGIDNDNRLQLTMQIHY